MTINPKTITLWRKTVTANSTIGVLDVFGTGVFTLEDTRRDHKVFGETRIPAGRYRLDLRNEGGMNARYMVRFNDMHRGMIWLKNVPEFDFIYIHPGNTAKDTLGCILVGLARDDDRLISSVAAYKRIYPLIVDAIEDGGCYIEIKDEDYGSAMVD
jgi:hypothetical protein